MEPNVSLDMILKKFTIIYGNVESFNLLMRDFYRADQREPNQLPHQEEQRLLKDSMFHGRRKSIRDSIKYCFADASVD